MSTVIRALLLLLKQPQTPQCKCHFAYLYSKKLWLGKVNNLPQVLQLVCDIASDEAIAFISCLSTCTKSFLILWNKINVFVSAFVLIYSGFALLPMKRALESLFCMGSGLTLCSRLNLWIRAFWGAERSGVFTSFKWYSRFQKQTIHDCLL